MSRTKTISTRKFAEIVEYPHGNIVRMVHGMVDRGELKVRVSQYQNVPGGKKFDEYFLNIHQASDLNSRLRTIDQSKWEQYLESQAKQVVKVDKPREVTSGRFDLPYGAAPVTVVADKFAIPYGAPADEPVLTMSSLEIAEATEKRHDNVMTDIRKMLADLGQHAPDFSGTYKTERGNTYECFNLPRREVDILLTGYSTLMRAAVIDRWRELEAQVAKPVATPNLNDPAALRGLLLGYTEQVMQLEHQVGVQAVQIEQDKPKVKVFTRLVDQRGFISFQKFCTQLNLHQRKVKAWLRDIGWLRADQWEVNPLPTAKAVDAGYCDIKRFETVNGTLKQQIVFTGKAEAYVELKAPDYIRKPVRKERKKAA